MYRSIMGFWLTCLSTVASAHPVMIFMGGFGSCPLAGKTSELKATAQIDALVARARYSAGERISQIRTCYALGSDTIYVNAPDLSLEDEAMTRDDFHNVVREIVNVAGDSAPIYVWGQSHGGWTAMDLIRQVHEFKYRVLMTVDPISIPECGPGVFTGGVIAGSAPGCRGAPKDLEPSYELIQSRVAHWTNWYQKEFTLLHSDKIPNATENIERFLNASWWIIMGAHRLTETDDVMWNHASQKVINDLQNLRITR